jgi:nitroreductase
MEANEIFKNNVAPKKFSQMPIDESKLKLLSAAIRSCPSMDNRQPWKVVFIRSEEIKKNLSAACSNNKSLIEAPIAMIVCGMPDEAYPTLGGYLNSFSVDAGILIGRITIVAGQMGMHTDWQFSFREEKVREIIRAPEECRIVSISPLGAASEINSIPPAKQLHELVNYDHY